MKVNFKINAPMLKMEKSVEYDDITLKEEIEKDLNEWILNTMIDFSYAEIILK